MKPKVQIVHLQTPKVIITEPANFQNFVQSLTGKLAETKNKLKKPEPAESRTLALAVQKSSRSIAKMKPKVKIVHIQTPEVIETEPGNFQTFVQSLTGKYSKTKIELKKPEFSSKEAPMLLCDESWNRKTGTLNGYHSSLECQEERFPGEEKVISWETLHSESFNDIEDWDKFINELADFPLFPEEYLDKIS